MILQILLDYVAPITAEVFFLYTGLVLVSGLFFYYFFRWVFAINKITRELEATRRILLKIAQKQGVDFGELEKIEQGADTRSW